MVFTQEKIVLVFYHEQQRLVLCEGVLEISPMDTIVRVRSRAYWCDRKHEYQSDNRYDSQEHS